VSAQPATPTATPGSASATVSASFSATASATPSSTASLSYGASASASAAASSGGGVAADAGGGGGGTAAAVGGAIAGVVVIGAAAAAAVAAQRQAARRGARLRRRRAPREREPVLGVGKGLRVGHVVAQEDNVGAPHVLRQHLAADGLPANVPHLQRHGRVAHLERLFKEVDAHRLAVHALEAVLAEARADGGLARGAVAHEDELEGGGARHFSFSFLRIFPFSGQQAQ